jgi:ankyrin repeat protein
MPLIDALIKQGAEINGLDSEGLSPLSRGVWQGYAQIVSRLLEQGANPNFVALGSPTPLLLACRENKKKWRRC